MWNDIGIKYFDIIIDDGFHSFDAACCLYENSIHKLKKGGIYIIEDITLEPKFLKRIGLFGFVYLGLFEKS